MEKSHLFFDKDAANATKKTQKAAHIRILLFSTIIPTLSILSIFCSFLFPKELKTSQISASLTFSSSKPNIDQAQITKEARLIADSLSVPIIKGIPALSVAKAKEPPRTQEMTAKPASSKTASNSTSNKVSQTKQAVKKPAAKVGAAKPKKPLGGDTAPVAMNTKHAMDENLPVAKLDPKPASAQYGIPEYWPLPVPVSDPYGYRAWRGRVHSGIDLTADAGTPICAAGAGKIIRAEWYCGYGNCIDIEHASGYITRYGHLSSYYVKVGQWVDEGEWIGGVGTTGNSSCNHLHYEVFLNGRTINPESLRYINKVTSTGPSMIFASISFPI